MPKLSCSKMVSCHQSMMLTSHRLLLTLELHQLVRCLDIQPNHVVLDMCASPGSKTGQVLEALHGHGDGLPTGCVIACEPNLKRCNNLYGNMIDFR